MNDEPIEQWRSGTVESIPSQLRLNEIGHFTDPFNYTSLLLDCPGKEWVHFELCFVFALMPERADNDW